MSKKIKPFTRSHNPKQYWRVANQNQHMVTIGLTLGYTLTLHTARAEWVFDFWMNWGASWAEHSDAEWFAGSMPDFNSVEARLSPLLDVWQTEFNYSWKMKDEIN